MSVIVGIDPGLKGGIAIRNGCDVPVVHSMPLTAAGTIDWWVVDSYFGVDPESQVTVAIEDLFVIPKQGIKSALTIGKNYGFPVLCQARRIPYHIVQAKRWQKMMLMGLPTHDKKTRKQSSIVAAGRLFPSLLDSIGKSDGKAEALLIMEYGRRTLSGQAGG